MPASPILTTDWKQAIVYFLANLSDPTTLNLNAPKGSVYLWVGDTGGTLWQKQDEGISNNWTKFEAASGAGTVTSITAGTGLTASPNPITTSGTISLANTAVTPGSYTSANITVNAQGQITAATSGGGSGANVNLSNLVAPTAVNVNLLSANGTQTLGDATHVWSELFTNEIVATASLTIEAITGTSTITMTASGNISLTTDGAFPNNVVTIGGPSSSVKSGGPLSYINQSASRPTSVSAASIINSTQSSYFPITSASAVVLGSPSIATVQAQDGQLIKIVNVGTFNITIQNGGGVTNPGATNFVLMPGSAVNYVYDAQLTSWLFDSTSQSSGANQQLSNLSGTVAVNLSLVPASAGSQVLGSAADYWGSSFIQNLNDSSSISSIAVFGRQLTDATGSLSLGWFTRTLVDGSGVTALSWVLRRLEDTVGATQLSWSTSGITVNTALILNGSTSGTFTQSAAATTTSYSVKWPAAQGSAGQFLEDTDGAGTLGWATPSGVTFDFGPGTDGAAVLDGTNTYPWATLVGSTYTMLQTVYLTNLTINSGITLVTNSFSLYGNGTLSNAGTINNNGTAGGNGGVGGQGSAGTAGNGGGTVIVSQNSIQDLGTGATANPGVSGTTGAGSGASPPNGNAGFFESQLTPLNALGGSGGSGGSGVSGIGGGGATDTTYTAATSYFFKKLTNLLLISGAVGTQTLKGGDDGCNGADGAGDGTNHGGGGGGGGGSGGVLGIWFNTFNNTGLIQANGGAGGAGESPTTGNVGGGGGAGGGAGGLVYIVRETNTATGTITATGGTGGALGAGHGTGTAGTAGTAGGAGQISLYTTSTGTWT